MMKDLEKFKEIFEGLDCAYGQTVKTDQFSEKGKHKTKSFTITKRPENGVVLILTLILLIIKNLLKN